MKYRILAVALVTITAIALPSCKKAQLGSPENPIKLWLMPLKSEAVFKANAPKIKEYLERKTSLAVEPKLADSFIDMVTALGKKKADIAFMNTLGYLLAHDWAHASAQLQYVYGDIHKNYRGEIVVRVGSGIDKPQDLNGKTFAFADRYSASGYLYVLKYFKDHNIKPAKTIFAGGHLNAVEMVYRGEADAAATYHDWPTPSGMENDARIELKSKYPDILSVVKILALTSDIPNGPVATRKELPDEVKTQLVNALLSFANSPEGRKTLMDLYTMTGLAPIQDSAYDGVRSTIREMGETIQNMVPGGDPYYRTSIEMGLE